jgi:hypothetical protein
MGKRGPKRQQGVKRTASGRISRAVDAHYEHLEAIHTRMRLFGLSESDARDQKAATFLGRLYLTGQLGKRPGSDNMWEAAQELLRMRDAYKRALKAPDALRNSTGSGGDMEETEAYANWCHAVVERYEAVERAVSAENSLHEHRGSNLHAALDFIVFRDQQMHHMIGDVRIALNAIHHHLTGGRKSRHKGHVFYGPTVAPEAA